jgi:C1A family cysteine protease
MSTRAMGWIRDYPDIRDYSIEHETVPAMLRSAVVAKTLLGGTSRATDLREWCSPVVDQGKLSSCTANAVAGALEYSERRAFGNYIQAGRLFIYKQARFLAGVKGDGGAYIRSAMGALSLFGAPLEKYNPYVVSAYDKDPAAVLYALAENYKAITYFRLDMPGVDVGKLLDSIRLTLGAGTPVVFGFTVYDSFFNVKANGVVPFPKPSEKVQGGHAVGCYGYDDFTGCLTIKNSWGPGWGDAGYCYMPYDFILKGLVADVWGMTKASWIDTGMFV